MSSTHPSSEIGKRELGILTSLKKNKIGYLNSPRVSAWIGNCEYIQHKVMWSEMSWFYSEWVRVNSVHYTQTSLRVKQRLQGQGEGWGLGAAVVCISQLSVYICEWPLAGHQRITFQRITVSWTAANKRICCQIPTLWSQRPPLLIISPYRVKVLYASAPGKYYRNQTQHEQDWTECHFHLETKVAFIKN